MSSSNKPYKSPTLTQLTPEEGKRRFKQNKKPSLNDLIDSWAEIAGDMVRAGQSQEAVGYNECLRDLQSFLVHSGEGMDAALQTIQTRADAATKGPWAVGDMMSRPPFVHDTRGHVLVDGDEAEDADLEFIAHARTDIPALLTFVEIARARILEAEKAVAALLGTPRERA